MVRKSCAECAFKTWNRVSDLTLYDCWSIGKLLKEWDDNKGTGGILVHTAKALEVLKSSQADLAQKQVVLEKTMSLDGIKATQRVKLSATREAFFADLDNMDMYALQRKYFPVSLRSKFFATIKPVFFRIGILKLLNQFKRSLERSKK